MARTRTQAKERQFKRRARGVMKKTDDIYTLIPDIKAAVLFLDGANLWTYESEEGWVSSLSSMTNLRVERMNPTHFRTVFEHRQALARASETTMAEAGSLPLPPLTPDPTLFASPSALEVSPPSSTSTSEITRQLLSGIQSVAPSKTIAQRRSNRVRTAYGAAETKERRVADFYGFMGVGDGSVNEI